MGTLEHVYTCPAHPHLRIQRRAICPSCGISLEPVHRGLAGIEPIQADEFADLTHRLATAAALTLPVVFLALADALPGKPVDRAVGREIGMAVQLAFTSAIVLWAGLPLSHRALWSLVRLRLNSYTLTVLGTGLAYAYSAVAVLRPEWIPNSFRAEDGTLPLYFHAAAVVTALVLLGQVAELRARSRTHKWIGDLLAAQPKVAHRVTEEDDEIEVPAYRVWRGHRLRVGVGMQIPTDGIVIDGNCKIDQSLITGDRRPVAKKSGDHVFGATTVCEGVAVVRATDTGEDTVLAQIVRAAGNAQRSKAPVQAGADKVSRSFVPAVIVTAALTFLAWSAIGPEPRMAIALMNAVAVLIVACPCALALAAPTAISVATGVGAKHGILFRNAEAMETMANIDTLVIGKTGILTEGSPELTTIETTGSPSSSEILALAAAVEQPGDHPIATAIVHACRQRGMDIGEVATRRSLPGRGVTGTVGAHRIVVGNRRLLNEMQIDTASLSSWADALRKRAQTAVFVAVDGKVAGLIGLADPIKHSTREALARLKRARVDVVMVTGDDRATGDALAAELGIKNYQAEASSETRSETVSRLQAEGRVVAVAGTLEANAPAMTRAHLSIGTYRPDKFDAAATDVTLVGGDLGAIARARKLSSSGMRKTRQNLFFAFFYNALALPIAAGLLYPLTGSMLSPMLAGATMTFSSVLVINNALRLNKLKI